MSARSRGTRCPTSSWPTSPSSPCPARFAAIGDLDAALDDSVPPRAAARAGQARRGGRARRRALAAELRQAGGEARRVHPAADAPTDPSLRASFSGPKTFLSSIGRDDLELLERARLGRAVGAPRTRRVRGGTGRCRRAQRRPRRPARDAAASRTGPSWRSIERPAGQAAVLGAVRLAAHWPHGWSAMSSTVRVDLAGQLAAAGGGEAVATPRWWRCRRRRRGRAAASRGRRRSCAPVAGDHAVGGARVLDLEHHPLVWR